MIGPTRILATYILYASVKIKTVACAGKITMISGNKPSSVALSRSVDHIKAPNLLRRGEMETSYLRKGSTLSSGSRPSEVGMGDGSIRRSTPEEAIGTCMWTKGNPMLGEVPS